MNHGINFKNKKVLVMGLGLHGGGLGTVKWLYKQGAKVTVTDLKTEKELATSLKKLKYLGGIVYHLGGHYNSDFSTCDFVVKGPGVPVNSEYLKTSRKNKIPIITDINIFLANLPRNVKIIGVTGTKGKSTIATLIAKILEQKYKTHLAGNIRKPVLEILPKIKIGDFVVLELSSFQLEDIADLKYRFPVAVLTSLFPDHLNRHKTFAAYKRAKEIIFKHQKNGDLLVTNGDDLNVRRLAKSAKGRVMYVKEENFEKNAAIAIGKFFVVPVHKIKSTIENFRGLAGRLEEIRELNGVIFINDTTATNPGAAIYGIKFVHKKYPNKKLVVIAGGADKDLEVGELVTSLKKFAQSVVLLPGSATNRILKDARRNKRWLKAKGMPEAVREAYQLFRHRKSEDGGIILLSPGAASFGLFLHEFDRGDKFNATVKKLK